MAGSRPRDPVTGYLTPRFHCEMYSAGHNVHWIQALRSSEAQVEHGWVEEIEGTLITIEFPDRIEQFRHHDPERFREMVGHGPVRVATGWALLRWADYCFSIARDDGSWPPCRNDPLTVVTPDALAERLRTHGGFSVPAGMLGPVRG